jgi:cyclopropane fatty-acyl-phospholipid synthase-like methyltransferase
MELTDKNYWNKIWQNNNIRPLNVRRYIVKRFIKLFSGYLKEGMRLIEIGCANSAWLPLFSERFKTEITGIDYSEIGINKLRSYLKEKKIVGKLYNSDFRNPPDELFEGFDILISFGLVEHFRDFPVIISKLSWYLKRGGIIITIIPNLSSPFYVYFQKKASKNIFNRHEIITKTMLCEAHKQRFTMLKCDYYGGFDPTLINFSDAGKVKYFLYHLVIFIIDKLISPILNFFHIADENKIFSSHIVIVAKKIKE